MMLRFVVACVALAIVVPLQALAAESNSTKIYRALSAGPAWLRANATVAVVDAHGNPTILKQGSNGFTCVPGTPGVVGDDPMCADAQGLIWVRSLMLHKPKPENTAPGVIYMLAGGTDWSATSPWVNTGKQPFHDPPHWMIMWPFDPKKTGLKSTFSTSGTWVMWSGTPYAHLMIIQKP